MSFHDDLRDRVRQVPFSLPPAPWKKVESHAVGGLTEVGFGSQSELLLVVSSSGRGVIDCRTGKRLARDTEEPDDGWYDDICLTALGIGPLGDGLIRLAGLCGGGLPSSTSDGWSVSRIAPDWPFESIVLDPPGSSVMYERHAVGCTRIAEGYGIRAYGFSETGLSLVVASSDGVEIWSRAAAVN